MSLHAPSYNAIARHLVGAQRTLILNPERGDGDSLGSTLALAHHVRSLGKEVDVFSHKLAPATYAYLPGLETILSDLSALDLARYDVIIAIDFADPKMSGLADQLAQYRTGSGVLVVIDHHPTNQEFGTLNVIEPTAAASAEMIFELFTQNRWRITPAIATCLLTGIIADTSAFANRNTTHASLAIAAELLAAGGNLHTIYAFAFKNKSVSALTLWGRALSRLQQNEEGIATTYITQHDVEECGVDDEATVGLANFLNKLDGVRAALILRELPDGRIKGSYRTTRDDVDVAALAARYGGGGHRRAAGFSVLGHIESRDGNWKIV